VPIPDVSAGTRRLSTFEAMGTTVSVYGPNHDAFDRAHSAVRTRFEEQERRFSRFRADSELTAVNASSGAWIDVSPSFEALVRFSLERAEQTAGLFDPTVLDAMIAAGYDRDLDQVIVDARGALSPPTPCGRWREVAVRPGAICVPADVGLDFGGVAKGWTVDEATRDALEAGLPWALISAGGDLAIGGEAPQLDIPVEDPDGPETPVMNLRLDRGALASSSIAKRTWGPGLHHLIDPRTGAPAVTDVVQATVWATTCAHAETLATWALLVGRPAAGHLACSLVTTDGTILNSFGPELPR
jgi:thiamine biosynthesis lipoprotein ApbE